MIKDDIDFLKTILGDSLFNFENFDNKLIVSDEVVKELEKMPCRFCQGQIYNFYFRNKN